MANPSARPRTARTKVAPTVTLTIRLSPDHRQRLQRQAYETHGGRPSALAADLIVAALDRGAGGARPTGQDCEDAATGPLRGAREAVVDPYRDTRRALQALPLIAERLARVEGNGAPREAVAECRHLLDRTADGLRGYARHRFGAAQPSRAVPRAPSPTNGAAVDVLDEEP